MKTQELKYIDKRIKELGGGGGMVQHANEYHDPDMALATHNHDATYVNEADHTKEAHDALNIDADTLDGHDTAYFETPTGAQAKVDAHKDLATGVHGVGASTIETIAGSQAKVDTHKGADVSPTVHPNANTHIGASAPHSGHVQVAGQLGGTAASPDVRGIRETFGPTLLTLGSVSDGQYLKRSGTTLIGDAPSGAGDLAVSKRAPTGDVTIAAGYSAIVVGDYEIASGYILELAVNAVMEIS